MFNRIVWATDGSETAAGALPYAKALATGDGRSLIVVHAKEHFVAGRASGYPVLADEDELEARIREQVRQAHEEGLDATLQLPVGSAGHTAHIIADAARAIDADVIVVGTRGLSAVVGLLVGSVTQQLLHIAHCPVLAVPPPRTDKGRRPR